MGNADSSSTVFPWKGVLIVAGFLLAFAALAALLLPQMCSARETARANTCRNRMRSLGTALYNYAVREGRYPGYINVLRRTDDTPFTDPTLPDSTTPVPISWAVLILPDIDQQPLYDLFRRPPPAFADEAKNQAESSRFYVDNHLEQFLCPSDQQASKAGTSISFVVNTGMPDLSAARPAVFEQDGSVTSGTPRDWAVNGMFFDHFAPGPRVFMTDDRVVDPKIKTILLTENVDATSYVFRAATHGADNWKAAEVQTGCIWRPGPVDARPSPPTMTPPVASLQPNVGIGQGDGTSYDYCRPSSRHPGYVNVAFVGQNVTSLRDNISYYVYAKLMASDDVNVRIPGMSRAESDAMIHRDFRTRQLSDLDVNP